MDYLLPEFEDQQRSPELSRRVFVKGLGLVSVGLVLGVVGGCDLDKLLEAIANRPMRRWLRTGSAEVDADIATYRQGVQLMKNLGGASTSWNSQAAIHGVGCCFNFCQHGNSHFFDWHRAYLLNFERIIQKLTGNAKWGLPYWNWNQTPDIHPAFLDQNSVLFLGRTHTTMTGEPSGATTTSVLDPFFQNDHNFFTFSPQIEGWPHNTVHGWVGQTMGSGGSAMDPLFWVHHCMVDYCWNKWNIELGNDNTNDATWVNTNEEHLVDADGNPFSMTAGLTTVLPLLSYQYESSAIGSSPATAAVKTKRAYEKLKQRVQTGANIRFDIKRRVPIAERAQISIARPMSKETKLATEDVAAIVNSNAAQERIFASVEFAQLPPESDFFVRVFVNLPNATSSTPQSDPHFAGGFAFFGTTPANTAAPSTDHAQHQPNFLVNLTDAIQRLRSRQELKENQPISIQLVPVPFQGKFEREDAQLVLNKIEIIITPVIVKSQQ
jgi:tyrosinase